MSWVTGTAAASTALLVGSLAANPEVAQQAAPLVFVPQIILAGFFIKSEQIPVYMRWCQWLCALKYGLNLHILNEFGPETTRDWPVDAQIDAATLVNSNEIDEDHAWMYMLILVVLIIVFRLLSIGALAHRAKRFF